MEVEHKELEFGLRRAYATRVPVHIWGATGIGKSEIIRKVARDIAKEKGLTVTEEAGADYSDGMFGIVDQRISQMDPSDLRGLPKPEGETTRWVPPNWLPTYGEGIILLDEMNLAAPIIQASAYQLILDRKLGDYKLPDGWVIFAAGNRQEDRANVFQLSAPLLNRFTHYTLTTPSSEAWTDWALTQTEPEIDPKIIAFLQFKKERIWKFEADMKDYAFPTPRSWVVCSKLISGINIDARNPDKREEGLDQLELLAASSVGEAVAVELKAFLKTQMKLNTDDILNNPEQVSGWGAKQMDMKYALVSSVCEMLKPLNKDKERQEFINKVVGLSLQLDAEFGIFCSRMVKHYASLDKKDAQFKKMLACTPKWKEYSKRYGKMIV